MGLLVKSRFMLPPRRSLGKPGYQTRRLPARGRPTLHLQIRAGRHVALPYCTLCVCVCQAWSSPASQLTRAGHSCMLLITVILAAAAAASIIHRERLGP